MKSKMRISWSKINLYRQCPFKWKKVNLEKIYEPETIFLWRGKVLHGCIEKLSNQFLIKNLESLDTILQQFEFHFMRKSFQKALQVRMCTEGKDILTQFYFLIEECDILKNLQKTEYYFKIPLPKVENIVITGLIDRLDLNINQCSLTDYKDGRKHPFIEYADQLNLYQWAIQKSFNYEIDKISIHLLKSHEILSRNKFTDKETDKLINEIYDIIAKIKNKEFEPKTNEWCKYCIFKDECGI